MRIFKVKLQSFKKDDLKRLVGRLLARNRNLVQSPVCIATLNPEILLKAAKDTSYAKILNNFELRVVDGFGITLCSFILKFKVIRRYAGADLAEFIVAAALKNQRKVALLLHKQGLSTQKELTQALARKFGKKKSLFCKIYTIDPNNSSAVKIDKETEVLLVGLGAPAQERLIWRLKSHLPQLKIAIGVGGTFDFWTKRVKRAPKILKFFGLEWFWRLLTCHRYSQRKARLKRIFRAVIVFPFEFIFNNSK